MIYMMMRGRFPAHFHLGVIMTSRFKTFYAVAALSFATTMGAVSLTTTPAAAAGAQYCIARGSANGDAAYVGNCVYSDYQQCLQAAADSRGNCVQNIDYRPGTTAAPLAPRSRRAR